MDKLILIEVKIKDKDRSIMLSLLSYKRKVCI